MTVPVADPQAESALFAGEINEAMRRVVAHGAYMFGPETMEFEREFAAFTGARVALGVASGTDAITLALRACGVGDGDEVITVSHTAGATVAGILHAGSKPVLVDIDPVTMTLDPDALETARTDRTRAVVPVHLYGGAADLSRIHAFAKAYGLVVVEDCAQAHGTTYRGEHVGCRADAAAFSFYPTKNLAALGDGGAVITSRPEVAERVALLRQYGWRTPQVSECLGWNSRLDELQAAVLRVKLRHFPRLLAARRETAEAYGRGIEANGLTLPVAGRHAGHSFHLYVVRSPDRAGLAEHLRRHGVATAVHYTVPVHLQPGYAELCVSASLPATDDAVASILSLPMFSAMSEEARARVVEAVSDYQLREKI